MTSRCQAPLLSLATAVHNPSPVGDGARRALRPAGDPGLQAEPPLLALKNQDCLWDAGATSAYAWAPFDSPFSIGASTRFPHSVQLPS